MRLLFWVTALAVLSVVAAKNATAKAKPKRQLDSIRTQQNLQYSLVLPHSRVQHFRALTNTRRVSNTPTKGKLPPYAVQMEPVVQYSQKDPLYDPTQDNHEETDTVVNKNEIYAQSKILNIQDQDQSGESYGPAYGTLPTAPLYSNEPHRYPLYEEPEPIIEIIIKESNESLPAPPPPPPQKKKKEPVHVFYVKYSKDPHSKDKVIYEKPIPAITPATNEEDDHHDDDHQQYVTVTPEPYLPARTTTLRAIIKPESEVYHSDTNVKITFGGNEGRHYGRREGNSEGHEETAPKPALAFPNTPLHPTHQTHPQLERTASPKPQFQESSTRPTFVQQNQQHIQHPQLYKPGPTQSNNRIQFQQPNIPNEQQLPRQGPSVSPFRPQPPPHTPRGPIGPTPIFNGAFSNGPIGVPHFVNPTAAVPGPIGPSAFPPTSFPRSSPPAFHSRTNNPQAFPPRPPFNGPPRASFHSGPQRPFPSQPKNYFDDPKYLQENYHTITTEQVEQPKHQLLPNRPLQSFGPHSQPSPSPSTASFQEHRRPLILNQQLPQQRPAQPFLENKPPLNVNPSASPFFNLKPSPPLLENNRPPFQQFAQQSSNQHQFSFHHGPQGLPRPSPQIPLQPQHGFSSPINVSPSPSPLPNTQFVPQPSAVPLYNFHPQPSPTPEIFHHQSPSERPQFQHHGPSERPSNSFQDPSNEHRQNVGALVPNGGELVPAISKYEQHITVNGPTVQPFGGFSPSQPSPTPSQEEQRYHQLQQQYAQQQREQQQREHHQREQQHREQQHRELQHREQQQREQQQREEQHREQQHREQQHREQHQREQQQREQQQHEHEQRQHQHEHEQRQHQHQHEQRQHQHQQQLQEQQYRDAEQEQVRLQLAQNVQKQQEEIQRLQAQLQQVSQQQQLSFRQHAQESSSTQYIHERSRLQPSYQSSTSSPAYYQSTSRTVEIKPTTQKYVSSTQNSISTAPEDKKEEKKQKKPAIELPDEVPDDLREQLLSSGILDNADISVLDYDKVGDTPLDSLPPDQLANFFSAGGGQQIASSENRPVYVKPDGDKQIQSRIDEDIDEDQDFAASENVPSYVSPPSDKQGVEMKVVHFNPETSEGQTLAKEYIKENATQVDPVALNDKRYNRYLPLKVSGNQFPLPDILKGRKITSVVVLAPVETEVLNDHTRTERATASENLKGIKFVAGESLQQLLKKPTKDNFEKWLEVEKKTASDLQSVVLLVTGDSETADEKEIFMYDILSGNVNKLNGDLSNAFVEAAENNSISKDIESLAIEGEGTPENFDKTVSEEMEAEGSENVPLFVDLSGLSLDHENTNAVSISSGYSKTKHGRSLRRRS